MTDPSTIASKLTEAQRRAVLGQRDLSQGAGMWPLRHALYAKGLVHGFNAGWTDLGLAVRQHLLSTQGQTDD